MLFLLEQEGYLGSRLWNLGEQRDALIQQSDALSIPDLIQGYRDVGRDLLRLLHFVELNAIGLRKILKKFDKRFGYKFTNYYVKTRANHPYSQLKQVFKHVVRQINSHIFIIHPSDIEIKHVQGISAVVGTLTRNLVDLQDHHESFISIYDQPALYLPVFAHIY